VRRKDAGIEKMKFQFSDKEISAIACHPCQGAFESCGRNDPVGQRDSLAFRGISSGGNTTCALCGPIGYIPHQVGHVERPTV
jgi:hypothetical protein